MKIFRIFFLFAFYLIIFNSSVTAQTYGKIYLKEEADLTYGPVISSINIKTADLQQILDKAGNFILFNIQEGRLTILGEGRKVLCPAGISADDSTVFKMFSVSIVRELLLKGKEETTRVENRKDVLSLTNGAYTLEFAAGCPPICG
ncbi:MAG TPA: hypothetical protein VHO43_10365 [Ignavibacteriales bacterium]|nr:hypothetical protein [Ignavibacteriales bacterium]